MVSFTSIFFLSISILYCSFKFSDISFEVTPPNIFPFSPAFTFIVKTSSFNLFATSIASFFSFCFLNLLASFFDSSFPKFSFVASTANFFGNK